MTANQENGDLHHNKRLFKGFEFILFEITILMVIMKIGWGTWAFLIFICFATGSFTENILLIIGTLLLGVVIGICYDVYEDKKIAEKHAKEYNKYKSVIEHPLTYEDLEEWQNRLREEAKNVSTPEDAENLLKQVKQLEYFKNQKIRTRKPKS